MTACPSGVAYARALPQHRPAFGRPWALVCRCSVALALLLVAAATWTASSSAQADRFSDSRSMRGQRVVSGGNFTCAILANGSVRCWGSNVVGQLGYGNKNTIGDN